MSITAGCGSIHPRATILVGLIGGAVYCGSSELLQKLKIDDPVEAFPVHGACGIWGVMAVPLFDINNFGVGGNLLANDLPLAKQLGAQILGVFVIVVWTGVFSMIMFSIIKAAGFLLVGEDIQEMGIDYAEFEPKSAYQFKYPEVNWLVTPQETMNVFPEPTPKTTSATDVVTTAT